jgi:hypothetical protein
MRKHSLKTALLATVALGTSAFHAAPQAAPLSATEIVAPSPVAAAVLSVDEAVDPMVKRVGWIAAGAAVLAAIGGFVGWTRIQRALVSVGPALVKVAGTAAAAPVAAAKAVAKAVSKPIRLVTIGASLALFSLLGLGLYDVEWLGGLLAGIAMVILAWASNEKARTLLGTSAAKSASKSHMRWSRRVGR